MNRSFFKTPWALGALLIVGGLVAWLAARGYSMGRAMGSDRGYLLWTGWIALALFLAAAAYSLRKFVHKMGVSPEFRMRVAPERVERAEARMNDLQRQVGAGVFGSRKELLQRAEIVLRDEGVQRVMRVVVVEGAQGLELSLEPTEPLGRVAKWMHMHLYLGVASGFVVLLHGGGTVTTPMGFLLNALTLVVIGTGLYGIVVWALGPTWMTSAERDLTIEEAFVLEQALARKVRAQLGDEPFASAFAAVGDPAWKTEYLTVARKRGEFPPRFSDDLAAWRIAASTAEKEAKAAKDKAAQAASKERGEACIALQDHMALVGQYRRVERILRHLLRVKSLLNTWRIVHVPASALLLGLMVIHALSTWWY